jgi:hypothetical protein
MGDIKPLGSEKLQGMDKIRRIMEIARFNEKIPNSVNETSKNEYNLTLADGNNYQIVREKSGYIIKQTISENTTEYIAPMKDRKYYKSYADALKRLNLMAKEMNSLFENKTGTSLFNEQKKYVLKTPNSNKDMNLSDDVENVPAPLSSDATSTETPSPMADTSSPMADTTTPETPEMDDETPSIPDMGDDTMKGGEETVNFKMIQKLTGKLAQKLRAMEGAENKMSSKDIKYVINSILSALNLDELSDEDKEDIMNKFEGIEAEEGMETGEIPSNDEDETGMGETPSDVTMNTGSEESSELGEDSWDESYNMDEEEDDDNTHIGRIADSIFMENKVEDVLSKYYRLSESEKKQNKKVVKLKNSQVYTEITRLSESKLQEVKAKKFLHENTSAKLIGKTNKKNLVFELNNKQYKITSEGSLKCSI